MSMQFKNIPQSLRVPLFYAEVDNSQANTGQVNQRALIIGQYVSSGTAAANSDAGANIPVLSQGIADAKAVGGAGSILALMANAYRACDNFGELWYLPLKDDAGATAASGSIAFSGTATAAGTLSLYIAAFIGADGLKGLLSVPVTSGMTAAQLATAVGAAINAASDIPVSATVLTSTVTLTADNKGLCGNDIDVRMNYRGTAGGEATPAGISFTITALSGGATNPSLSTGLANLSDQLFDFIICPYTDTNSLDALKAFLNDQTGRWSWQTQIYGHVFYAYRGTAGALTTFGTGRNDQHASCIGFYDSPTPNWIWAVGLAATAAVSLRADPGLPLHTLQIACVLAPPLQSRFQLTTRNTLLFDGISTFTVAADGTVAIEGLITTYQKNGFSQPDNSYLKVETMFLLIYVLRAMAVMVTSKYARVKLASNGTRVLPGSNVVTPNMIRADIIAKYLELQDSGYVQNADAFKAAVIVEKDTSNPNRVNVLWPGTLINQLDIFALLAQFRLV